MLSGNFKELLFFFKGWVIYAPNVFTERSTVFKRFNAIPILISAFRKMYLLRLHEGDSETDFDRSKICSQLETHFEETQETIKGLLAFYL